MTTRFSIPMSIGSLLLACIFFLTMPGCGSSRGERSDSESSRQIAKVCAVSTLSATNGATTTTGQFNTSPDGSARAVFTTTDANGTQEAHRLDVAAGFPFTWSNASDQEARLSFPTDQGTKNVLLAIDNYDPTTKTATLHLREEGGMDLGSVDVQDENFEAFFSQGSDGNGAPEGGATLVGQSLRPRAWFVPPAVVAFCAAQPQICAGVAIVILILIVAAFAVMVIQQRLCYSDLRSARTECEARSNAEQNCSRSTSGCNMIFSIAPPFVSLGAQVIGPCNCIPVGQIPPGGGDPGGPGGGNDDPPQPGGPPAPCPQHTER